MLVSDAAPTVATFARLRSVQIRFPSLFSTQLLDNLYPGCLQARDTAVRFNICHLVFNQIFFPPDFLVPETIDGNTLTATVVDLNAWVEYEFRVLARNSVGVGEPSPVSVRTRTEDAG